VVRSSTPAQNVDWQISRVPPVLDTGDRAGLVNPVRGDDVADDGVTIR